MYYAHFMRLYFIFACLFFGLSANAWADVEYPKSDLCAEIDAALAADISEAWRERLIVRAKACRLPIDDLSPAGALTILAGEPFALQRDSDAVTMVARGFTEPPTTCCSIQRTMEPLGDDLWALRYRLARIDEAMLFLFAYDLSAPPKIDESDIIRWRGPDAPPAPHIAKNLKGEISTHEIWSEALGETRRYGLYLPAVQNVSGLKVILVADGLGPFPNLAEALVQRGDIEDVIIVGLPSGQHGIVEPQADSSDEIRNADYMEGFFEDSTRYAKHQHFVLDELLPHLRREYGISPSREDVIVAGQSNGAVWALSTALQRPDTIGAAIVISAGWGELKAPPVAGQLQARFYMAAGTYEWAFVRSTQKSYDMLRAAGFDAEYTEYAAGHAQDMWDSAFAQALKLLAPASDAPQ